MPLYDYQCECETCKRFGFNIEILVGAYEPDDALCHECLEPMTRQASAPYGRVTDGVGKPGVRRRYSD